MCIRDGPGPALDFGCGGGAFAAALRARSARVEGCDVAAELSLIHISEPTRPY